jgi:hypothetical protein
MTKNGNQIFFDREEDAGGTGASGFDTVMYGGCGARFGSFRQPIDRHPKPRSIFSHWRCFRVRREKTDPGGK